jgi:osmotically-inducible protein OsmY
MTGISTDTGKTRATNTLTRKIENAFHNSKELKSSNIYAEVAPNGVLLTGMVTTEKQKYLASTIANSFVKKGTVINRITIIKQQISKPKSGKTKK